MRRTIIAVVTFLGGIYFFLEFVLPKYILVGETAIEFGKYDSQISTIVRVVFAMGLGLGVINLGRIHGLRILRKRKGWGYSCVLLGTMVLTTVVGFWQHYSSSEGMKNFFWQFIFQGLYNNLGSAMFSLLAFYIAAAAYRAFRLQSLEAGLMMAAALLVMFGQIPLGFFIWNEMPTVRVWLLRRIASPAYRGILFGSMIAGLSMGVRMWLSLERTSFGERR
jgi:hypothetical protein